MATLGTFSESRVDRELRDLRRQQERLEARIDHLQRSLSALRSDTIEVALAVPVPPATDG